MNGTAAFQIFTLRWQNGTVWLVLNIQILVFAEKSCVYSDVWLKVQVHTKLHLILRLRSHLSSLALKCPDFEVMLAK